MRKRVSYPPAELEDERDGFMQDLSTEQVVVQLIEVCTAIVIPRAGIFIQHCRCFGDLLAILASLALERVVRFAFCILLVLEQLTQIVDREMPFLVCGFVHNALGQRLFAQLTLKDLLLDRSSGDKPVYEA